MSDGKIIKALKNLHLYADSMMGRPESMQKHKIKSRRAWWVKCRLTAILAFLVGFGFATVSVFGQATDSTNLSTLSLEQLGQVQVKIASVADKPVREQPAIVSVITEKEIKETGAQDLMDVLSLVPGFSFQEDVSGMTGIGFRGFWAYEGKMLVLLDGIPVNDGLWGNVELAQHYSAEQIKQVEIIRGPGSARYGGNAELGVINITTKGAEQNGGFVAIRPEVVPGQAGVMVDGNIGHTFTNGWRINAGVSYDNFVNSDQNYVSESGTVVDMRARSGMQPYLFNASVGWKDLDLRFIYDNYEFNDPLGFGEPPTDYLTRERVFKYIMGSAKYDFRLSDSITISPKFTLQDEDPWEIKDNPNPGDYDVKYNKYDMDVPIVVDFNENNHLLAGVDAYVESARALDATYLGISPSVFFYGQNEVVYNDVAEYLQYDLDTKWADFSVGGRYEYHSYAHGAFVPRLSITRAWDRFHLKLLYDQAYRTPNIDDIYFQLGSKPVEHELTTSYQVEGGYEFTSHFSAVANLYYIRIAQPIVFTSSGGPFGAENGAPISSYGGELQLRYVRQLFTTTLGYSYYWADDQLSDQFPVALYGSSQAGLNLGQPQHKISASVTFHLTDNLDWNLNGTYFSATRAWAYPGTEQWLDQEVDLNTFINYHWKGAEVGAGIRNLLGEDNQMGQAYNGGAAPLPGLGRTFFVRLAYNF